MSIIDETIESVRSRGFLDIVPGSMAKDAEVVHKFCILLSRIGMVARGLFHDDHSRTALALTGIEMDCRELVNAMVDLKLKGESQTGIFDADVMYQMFKAVEELGEFAGDIAMQDDKADVELADVFVTVCSMAAAFGKDNGYDLEHEVSLKIHQDEERGHLHGAELSSQRVGATNDEPG